MLHVALTGGIASGKSTVSDMFRELGVSIIDADEIARDIVKPGTEIYQEIVAHFGEVCCAPDGTLDRAKLRDIIFNDIASRIWLEKLMHPLILLKMHQATQAIHTSSREGKIPYCILSIPLLTEMELYLYKAWIHYVLVVDCCESLQIERLRKYKHYHSALIHKMLHAQSTRQQRLDIAHDVIHNNDGLQTLKVRVLELHKKYTSLGAVDNSASI